MAPAIEEGLQLDALRRTQLVLMPSATDVTCHPTYPQWPLQPGSHTSAFADPDVRKRVTVVPNPATFVVGGVVVGGTSADVLFQLNANDTTRNAPPPPGAPRFEKIPRMAQHLLEQRSYFPLFPAPDPVDAPLEMTQLHHAGMPASPDLLLLPSKLRQFTKALPNGTLVVNPGALCRANSGGTYARISLFPPTRGAMKTRECRAVGRGGGVNEGRLHHRALLLPAAVCLTPSFYLAPSHPHPPTPRLRRGRPRCGRGGGRPGGRRAHQLRLPQRAGARARGDRARVRGRRLKPPRAAGFVTHCVMGWPGVRGAGRAECNAKWGEGA